MIRLIEFDKVNYNEEFTQSIVDFIRKHLNDPIWERRKLRAQIKSCLYTIHYYSNRTGKSIGEIDPRCADFLDFTKDYKYEKEQIN